MSNTKCDDIAEGLGMHVLDNFPIYVQIILYSFCIQKSIYVIHTEVELQFHATQQNILIYIQGILIIFKA